MSGTPGPLAGTPNLGANKFTFDGDRTQITYFPSTAPGPVVVGQEGGRLEYHGIEGDLTFSGAQIELQDSPLGTLVTIVLESNPDIGVRTLTLFVPQVFGVSREKALTFEITRHQSNQARIHCGGRSRTGRYTILPLLGNSCRRHPSALIAGQHHRFDEGPRVPHRPEPGRAIKTRPRRTRAYHRRPARATPPHPSGDGRQAEARSQRHAGHRTTRPGQGGGCRRGPRGGPPPAGRRARA